MKHVKKLASLLLVIVMVFAMATTVFAQTVGTAAAGTGSITIANAAKGETYSVYKLFDASVTGTEGGSIAYTGTIPDELSAYFTMDAVGNITATEAAGTEDAMSDGLKAALAEWVKGATAAASAESDGSALNFVGLDYGYYVVTTTQGDQAISVDSTNPNVTVYDKNTTVPSGESKTADDTDVSIGDTVTYTISFDTSNFYGAGEEAKKIISYTITDTLPEFLSDVTVTGIIVDQDGDAATTDDQFDVTEQFTDKQITIAWVDADGNSLYANGASITITYTAVVTDSAVIDGAGNQNEVTIQWTTEGNFEPEEEKRTTEETIYTYAAALKKVDDEGNSLAGAKFAANGLIVRGSKGNYTVVSYAPDSDELGTVMECDDSGKLVIKGLASDEELVVTETEAPAGYNKLVAPVTLKPTVIGEAVTVTSTTIYYDENGEVTDEVTESFSTTIAYNEELGAAACEVVNKTGSQLPSTGGVGTTVFYAVGSILVLAAVILLVTKRRMNAA